ncbi:MAG: hypothetical protein RL328_1749, partial [Acidobacteriota bacterium]
KGKLEPRHIVMRVFAIWDGQAYTVMPGGLTRVSTSAQSLVVSMQMGGGSKDTWVLRGGAEEDASHVLPVHEEYSLNRTDLPSRVADNLYWLGRYSERVESSVRLVRSLLPSLSGEEDFGHTATLDTAVQLLHALGYLEEEFESLSIAQMRWHLERLLSSMVYDPTRSSGIGWNLNSIRRVAWPLKERLSQDTWRVLQQLEAEFSAPVPVYRENRLVAQMNLLDRVIVTLSAFAGLLTENTTRGHGWQFVQIGKRLERALQMTELLAATFGDPPFDLDPVMQTLLQIADSSITYRSRYFTTVRPEYVLDLLLKDPTNPRSLLFQLAGIADHMKKLPGYAGTSPGPAPARLAEAVLSRIQEANVADLTVRDRDGNMPPLDDLLRQLKGELYDISDALTELHFSHVSSARFRTV